MTTALVGATLARLGRARLPGSPDLAAAGARARGWIAAQPRATSSTVAAGAEVDLHLAGGDLPGALDAADALLARMTTPAACDFGDHRFADDPRARGGIAPGGIVTAQSPWAATYNVGALVRLATAAGSLRHRRAADLLVGWLLAQTGVISPGGEATAVQDLSGGVLVVEGGPFGRAPELYEPGDGEPGSPTLAARVLGWVEAEPAAGVDRRPASWLEAASGRDLEGELRAGVRRDEHFARVVQPYPWDGSYAPRDLSGVAPGINPLLGDDVALALWDWLTLAPDL
jgi:hypothetical protein